MVLNGGLATLDLIYRVREWGGNMSRKWTDEDTRLRSAAMKEAWDGAQRLKEVRPYVQLYAVGDNRDLDSCLALDNIIVHIDNPWLQKNMPPHYDQCRCTIRTLSDRQMARDGLNLTEDKDLPLVGHQMKY